ncbi:MAG: DUF4296 domain-containing protein [Chitinophagaceae bacterium]
MRLLISLLLMVWLIASCGSSTIPSDIIPRDKMEIIIWQLMQADEYVNNIVVRDSSKKSSTERMKIYQQVFDLNKTSMSDFKRSYQFYMAHPDITKIMFDSIATKAGRQRTELYKPKSDSVSTKASMQHIQMEKHKADSIAKAGLKRTELKKIKPDSVAVKPSTQPIKVYRPKADTTTAGRKAAMKRIKLNKLKLDSATNHLKKQ